MKPKEIFTLSARLLGLVFLYHGLQVAPLAVAQLYGAILAFSIGSGLTNLVIVGWPLLLAYWLLRGAPFLVRIAYPDGGGRPERGEEVAAAVTKKSDV